MQERQAVDAADPSRTLTLHMLLYLIIYLFMLLCFYALFYACRKNRPIAKLIHRRKQWLKT